jgi:hypothetical protein
VNRQEVQAIIAEIPWVRRLKVAVPCQGFKAGTPMREIYNWGPGGQNPPLPRRTCKNNAWWHFRPLKSNPFQDGSKDLCWSHLFSRGIYGDMDEERRTDRWLKRHHPEIFEKDGEPL